MQDGRFSTIRFNEWICISAQYEKAVARIGRQVYQGFSKGLVVDFNSLEICREISETFTEARNLREELEEELERDALDGLNVEEAKKADEIRKLTQAQKTQRTVKLKFTKFMGRHSINKSLANHRDRVRDLSRDLGLRALARYQEEPVLKAKGHKALCRLAEQLNEDADKKWHEITESNKAGGGGLSFHTLFISFVGNFANFSKGTHIGKILLKFFKYNEAEEKEKLAKQYEGSHSAEALRAQMQEVDEPSLDVGREIDNMQQDYEGTPKEWSSPSEDDWGKDDFQASPAPADSASDEEWGVGAADSWNAGDAVEDDFMGSVSDADDDFLGAVENAPSFEAFPSEKAIDFDPDPPPAPPAPANPTLLRRRPEPEADSWLGGESEQSYDAPPPSSLPRTGPPADTTPDAAQEETDWDWGETSDEAPADPFSSQPNLPGIKKPAPESDPFAMPGADLSEKAEASEAASLGQWQSPPTPAPKQAEPEESKSGMGGVLSQPGGKRPPFVKGPTSGDKPDDWSKQPAPAPDWSKSEAPSPAPTSDPEDFGWTPASTPKVPEFAKPTKEQDSETLDTELAASQFESPSSSPPELNVPGTSDSDSDPLLRLLTSDSHSEEATKPKSSSDDFTLGDDLLPAFLRDRDDEQSLEDDTFIPELPSFLESEDGPKLEIVPFGTPSDGPKDKTDGEEDSFIPKMPDL